MLNMCLLFKEYCHKKILCPNLVLEIPELLNEIKHLKTEAQRRPEAEVSINQGRDVNFFAHST